MDLDLSVTFFLDYHHKERLSQYVQVMVPGIRALLTLYAHKSVKVCPQLNLSYNSQQ